MYWVSVCPKVQQNVMMWEMYPGGLHLLLATLGALDVIWH